MRARRHTAAERSKIIAAYRDLESKIDGSLRQATETGKLWDWPTLDEFARDRGVTRSTLYRWLRNEKKAPRLEPKKPELTDVNLSIAVIASDGVTQWEFIAGALNFSAWLLFPQSATPRRMRTLSLAAVYLGSSYADRTFDEFPQDAHNALNRFVTSSLFRSLSDITFDSGEHEYVTYFDTSFTDRDVLREVGFQFLDAHARGKRVSINEVQDRLGAGEVLPNVAIEDGAFNTLWRGFAATIPFLCAERSVGLDWNLPFDERRLQEHVGRLLNDRPRVQDYFTAAKRYADQFKATLDYRAWDKLVLPICPN